MACVVLIVFEPTTANSRNSLDSRSIQRLQFACFSRSIWFGKQHICPRVIFRFPIRLLFYFYFFRFRTDFDIMKQSLVFLACCLAISSVKCDVVQDVSNLASSVPVVGGTVGSVLQTVNEVTNDLPVNPLSLVNGLPVNPLSLLGGLPVNPLSLLGGLPVNPLSLFGGLPVNPLSLLGGLPVNPLSLVNSLNLASGGLPLVGGLLGVTNLAKSLPVVGSLPLPLPKETWHQSTDLGMESIDKLV